MRLLTGERCKDGWLVTLVNTSIVKNKTEIKKVMKEFDYKLISEDKNLIKAEKK